MSFGIDKLEAEYNCSLNENPMLAFNKKSYFCLKRKMRVLNKSFPYSIAMKQTYIRSTVCNDNYREKGIKLSLNPNHFPNFKVMCDYVQDITGVDLQYAKITRLDLNFDLAGPISYWKKYINVGSKAVHTQFYELGENKDSFNNYNLNYERNTLVGIHVGGVQSEERLSIYKKEKKSPNTRIEIKLTKRKLPVKKVNELAGIVRYKPFKQIMVRVWEVNKEKLSTEHRKRLTKDFVFLTEKTCLIHSVRDFQSEARTLNGLLKCSTRVPLDSMWSAKAKLFFTEMKV